MFKLLLLTTDLPSATLLRAAAEALRGGLQTFADPADLPRKLTALQTDAPMGVALDLATLAAHGRSLASTCAAIAQVLPKVPIVAIAAKKQFIDEVDSEWARQAGATDIVASLSPWRWPQTGERLLKLCNVDDVSATSATRRIAPYLRIASQASPSAPARFVAEAEARGIDLGALAVRMQRSGGVTITDRRYRLQSYPECFVASEGVSWLEGALRLSKADAIKVGQAMQAAGLIYHAAHEQVFDSENYFFRFTCLPPRWDIERFRALARGAGGLQIEDRQYMGTTYPRCFIGADAVRWMQSQKHSANEAICMGQRLIDLSILHHVVDGHGFKDEKLFYRFYSDNEPT
jgi:Domain found in Dishevelled, Egl-10, and Pleckstrin (DEP)